MSFLKDLFLGKYGLSKTYWRGLFIGGMVVLAGHVAATYVATMNLNNIILYDTITYGYAAFVFVWTIFICLAVINSSTYNRERGLWGWIASILACIGILRVLLVTV